MTKVLMLISVILALGFGVTAYPVLMAAAFIARSIFKMVADNNKATDFLVDLLIGAAFGAVFAPDLGVKRYFIAAVALVAAFALKRYDD